MKFGDRVRKSIIVSTYVSLEGWRKRRIDPKMEIYWKKKEERLLNEYPYEGLNSWQRFQQKWNFRESDYNHVPSNNGLDLGNPGFAYATNLVKYIVIKKAAFRNGKIIKVWRASEKEPTLEEFRANPNKYYGSPDAVSD